MCAASVVAHAAWAAIAHAALAAVAHATLAATHHHDAAHSASSIRVPTATIATTSAWSNWGETTGTTACSTAR
eukprot:3352219-Rhodomonas_salina.1